MKKIFIIHGWTYTTEKWNSVVGQLKSAGFEPVLLHVPGLTEVTDKAWTLDNYVEWLKEELKAENQPIVIGHSNGGRIALAFAAKYPEKLRQLILVDSAGIYHNELPIRLKRLVFGTMANIGKKFTSSPTIRKLLYKLAGENDYKNATPQMRQTMANLISMDLTNQLEKITTPTLIIWGVQDKATPLSDGKLIHQLIKKSDLYIIEGAGHSPHFSHSELVSKKILSAIK
jgi:pimeloyl-ACP methyl ester carboxylesterase